MAFPADPVKLRSQGLWPILLATASLGLGGCILDDGDPEDGYVVVVPAEEPKRVAIDADAVVSAEPGEGVGLFVEYAAGGTWRLSTTCDTNSSDFACYFDVFISVDTSSELFEMTSDDLEGGDEAGFFAEGIAGFHAETTSDVDAVSFTTTPGALVRIEMYLDGVSQPRYVYWFGDDVLHAGAPTNPIDFEPSDP